MESALRPPLPTATQALAELQIQPGLDQRLRAKHHRRDPRKQTPSGRHQIGIPAGFKSESVAGFLLECVAGFVGIRSIDRHLEQEDQEHQLCAVPIEVPHHRTHWPIERSLSQLQGVPPLRRFRTRNSAIVDKLTRIGPRACPNSRIIEFVVALPAYCCQKCGCRRICIRRAAAPANPPTSFVTGPTAEAKRRPTTSAGCALYFTPSISCTMTAGICLGFPLIERRRSSHRSRPSRAFRSAAARRPTANSSSSIGNLGSSAFRQHFGLGNQVIDLVNRPRRASLALLGLSAIVDLCDCNPALIKGEGASTAYRVLNLLRCESGPVVLHPRRRRANIGPGLDVRTRIELVTVLPGGPSAFPSLT